MKEIEQFMTTLGESTAESLKRKSFRVSHKLHNEQLKRKMCFWVYSLDISLHNLDRSSTHNGMDPQVKTSLKIHQ
jgi:hypothetical protein